LRCYFLLTPLASILWISQFAGAQTPDISTALALEQQGKTTDAERVWQAIVEADPKNAEALAHLGLLEARQEHYDAAIEFDRKALSINPDVPGLQLNLGLALFKAARFSEAIPAFQTELRKHPGDQRLTILIGMSHYGMGDYLVAIPYLQQAAAHDADNLAIRLTMAHSCLWSKQYQCVLDVGKEILALNPDSPEADMLAGEALDEQGDLDGAIAQFRAAVKANSKEPNAHFGLGYLLWKQSKYAEAAEQFKAETDNDPSQVQAHAYLGNSYLQLEQFDKAEPELLAAIGGDPKLMMAHRDLGIVYSQTGRNDLAVKALEQALGLDNQDSSTHFHLARIYRSMGRIDEAKAESAAASRLNKQAAEALTQKVNSPPATSH